MKNIKNRPLPNKPNDVTGYFGSILGEPTFRRLEKPKFARGKSDIQAKIEWVAPILCNSEPTGNNLKAAIWESTETVKDDLGNDCIATHFDAGWASVMAWEFATDEAKRYKKISLDYIGLRFEQWQETDDGKGEALPRLVSKAGRVTKLKPIVV